MPRRTLSEDEKAASKKLRLEKERERLRIKRSDPEKWKQEKEERNQKRSLDSIKYKLSDEEKAAKERERLRKMRSDPEKRAKEREQLNRKRKLDKQLQDSSIEPKRPCLDATSSHGGLDSPKSVLESNKPKALSTNDSLASKPSTKQIESWIKLESQTTTEYTSYEPQLDYDENEMDLPDINRDMKEATGKEFSIFKQPDLWPEDVFRETFRKTNLKQRDIIQHFKYCLRSDTEQIIWFIQGAAGTGKSFIIALLGQCANQYFKHHVQDPTYPIVMKMAPTGKAAMNITGITIHSAFGLTQNIAELKPLSGSSLNQYAIRWQNCKVIIIDEISMVGHTVLQGANQRLQQIKGNNKPFGGLIVLLFGDLRQLPPVRDRALYQTPEAIKLSNLAPNLFNLVKFYELTEIMRQQDDKKFAILLNHMADGTMTDSEIEFMRRRETTFDKIPSNVPLLFYTNAEVNNTNLIRLNAIDSQLVVCVAFDGVSGVGLLQKKTFLLEKAKKAPTQKTGNLPYKIQFKVGARYMLTCNIDTLDGLVNGSVGILRHIETCQIKNSKEMAVKRVWLEFIDAGKNRRQQFFRYMIQNKILRNWTPVDRIKKSIDLKGNGALTVIRNQIPLILAEAMTIHKSQGATFDEVAVGLTSSMTRALQYVACSRVKSANGLHLLNKFKPPKKDDPIVMTFKQLQQKAIIPQFQFLHESPKGLQIMYHNVQSLQKHYEDIKSDPCFMNSDVLLLAETWTLPKDRFNFPEFKRISQIVSGLRTRKPSGVSIYVKDRIDMVKQEDYPNYDTGVHISVLFMKTYRIVVLYAKPRSTTNDILYAVNDSLPEDREWDTILVGDFNIVMTSPEGLELRDILADVYDLHIRTNPIQYTTKGRTTIDAIFSTRPLLTCGVYESSFSYHLPLYAQAE